MAPAIADSLIASEDEIQRLFWADLAYLKTTPPIDYYFERPNFGRAYLHTPAWLIDDRQIGEPGSGVGIDRAYHRQFSTHRLWGVLSVVLSPSGTPLMSQAGLVSLSH